MISEQRLQQMAEDLVAIRGVEAVSLGGSRAQGTHHAGSDVDLGLYYGPGLDLAALRELARRWMPGAEVAGPGGWGPWVDGGGWLTVDGTAVDWILRNLDRVHHQCARSVRGEFAFHQQTGHPLGFLDVSYAGEAATGRPLGDPSGLLADLRAQLTPYPPALARAFAENLAQADFLIGGAAKAVAKHDPAYIALCCATALMHCAHAWHAAAGVWVLNEKGLIPDVARLDRETGGFAQQATRALAAVGETPQQLTATIQLVRALVARTQEALRPGADG